MTPPSESSTSATTNISLSSTLSFRMDTQDLSTAPQVSVVVSESKTLFRQNIFSENKRGTAG